MFSNNNFIKATEQYNTFEKNVPAYYFRRTFHSDHSAIANITVAVCGFYEIYFNGKNITKGFLSPYRCPIFYPFLVQLFIRTSDCSTWAVKVFSFSRNTHTLIIGLSDALKMQRSAR